MLCPNCGKPLPNDGNCLNCSYSASRAAAAQQQAPQQQAPYQQAPAYTNYNTQQNQSAPNYGYANQQQVYPNQGYNNQAPQQQFPMKWYKFLIYFSLFASAVTNTLGGIATLTGSHYGSNGESEMVYGLFESLKIVDLAMGIACLLCAFLSIYTRQKLAKFQADGPKFLNILYGVSAATSLIYVGAVYAIVSNVLPAEYASQIVASSIPTIVMAIVMILANKSYFDKRKSLFVN